MTERPDPLAPPEGYGARPAGWVRGAVQQVQSAQADKPDTLCCADRKQPSDPPVCLEERVFVFWVGDANEHILDLDVCAAHAGRLAEQIKGGQRFHCTICDLDMRIERIERVMEDGTIMPVTDAQSILANTDAMKRAEAITQASLDQIFRD